MKDNIAAQQVQTTFEIDDFVEGTVKNVFDYGYAIELEVGHNGFLHQNDLYWTRSELKASERYKIGQRLKLKVIGFSDDNTGIKLGLKQCSKNPWDGLSNKLSAGDRVKGHVVDIMDYGFIVQISESIEGIVHVSEMDWVDSNLHPSKMVRINDEIEVQVLKIYEARQHLYLGLKQCSPNPWVLFCEKYSKGDSVKVAVSSKTIFGLMVLLEGGITAIIHDSDILDSVEDYEEGTPLTCKVLSLDAERERISMSMKM